MGRPNSDFQLGEEAARPPAGFAALHRVFQQPVKSCLDTKLFRERLLSKPRKRGGAMPNSHDAEFTLPRVPKTWEQIGIQHSAYSVPIRELPGSSSLLHDSRKSNRNIVAVFHL